MKHLGAGVVAQQGKLLVKSWLLPIHLSANVPGKATEDTSGAWTSAIHVGDLNRVSGSCLQPGLTWLLQVFG